MMAVAATAKPETLADAVAEALAALRYAADGEAEPVAILWPDAAGQWRGFVEHIRERMPHLYELGTYDPATRTGPAIWLKCIVARALPDQSPPEGVVPILYLPGVARQELRAAGECRPLYQPLVELQFRGRVWHQRNGRDWTVDAFLTSPEALGLDVAGDTATQQAMLRAIERLADEQLSGMKGRRLDVNFFDSLSVSDVGREILAWMCDPEGYRKRQEPAVFETFASKLVRDFGIDPATQQPLEAAKCLARGDDKWDPIWQRYADAPKAYPKIQALMAMVPGGHFGTDTIDRNPQRNHDDEKVLRDALRRLASLSHGEACTQIAQLNEKSASRRGWVWAKLGESLLADALVPLARLASAAGSPLGGPDVTTAARNYARDGWQVDRDAMHALAIAQHSPDAELVGQVVRAVYLPWLERTAEHFQMLCKAAGNDLAKLVVQVEGEGEVCIVFADGLRFDAAAWLHEKLEARGLVVKMGHRISAIPTVTATAKPAVMPLPGKVYGASMPDTFFPMVRTANGDKTATTTELHAAMAADGVAVLGPDETGGAASDRGGWTEVGKIDERGHSLGVELAAAIEEQVERIARRVGDLLDGGWSRVRVVTDHGWLLVPGGLPKVDVPASVVQTKWSRAAAVQGASKVSVPVAGWHWNNSDRVATPPGVHAFRAGEAYSHGGISPQECVTPELLVERPGATAVVSITNLRWTGMRCRVKVSGTEQQVSVDLRLTEGDANSSVVGGPKPYDAKKGDVALLVADDTFEKQKAVVVVLDGSGSLVERMTTIVGGS
jgi:hypothetical protein